VAIQPLVSLAAFVRAIRKLWVSVFGRSTGLYPGVFSLNWVSKLVRLPGDVRND
jgi:hypothetical protein